MNLITTAVALALLAGAANPKVKPKPATKENNDTMKALVKDAVAPSPAATTADGGTVERPGPKVETMPFTQDSIKQVVAYYQPQIQACYEETLAAKDKDVEGKLLTSFVITPDGSVKKVAVTKKGTTLKEPKLHDCVIAVISSMVFPKTGDNKDHPIDYPFNLKATH